jgi:hypothetical protein
MIIVTIRKISYFALLKIPATDEVIAICPFFLWHIFSNILYIFKEMNCIKLIKFKTLNAKANKHKK